jgi:hypothetical protein
MARYINPANNIPSGACDACFKPVYTLMEVGMPCYHCQQGVFMHRGLWDFRLCPECGGAGRGACAYCDKTGWIVTPREDVEMERLREEWRSLPNRYVRNDMPIPAIIAMTAALADKP